MHSVVYDAAIVAVVLISALLGRRKGFVLTLCGFLALFVALIGSALLTGLLAQPLSSLAVPILENHLSELIQTSADGISPDTEAAIRASLDQVLLLMDRSDILSGLKGAVAEAVDRGALEITGDALHAVALYAAQQLTRLILSPLFFALIMLAWTALSHILDLAFHLPGLNFLNRTAGLLLGIVRGVVLVFGACWLLKDSYLSREVIDSSFLLPYFCDAGLLDYISILSS